MSTAIHVITESSDHYTYSEDKDLTTEELTKLLKKSLGDEFAWISDIQISGGDNIDVKPIYKEIEKELDAYYA